MNTPKDLLLIDIDMDYDAFMKYLHKFYLEHISIVLANFGLTPVAIEIKRSTNNHVHVKVKIDKEVDYETYLHLLLALGCDVGLVSIGLTRYKLVGDPLIKQFYKKVRPQKKKD